jgi:hypothetical protein
MKSDYWIKLFDNMDSNAPPPIKPRVYKGGIGKEFVQESENSCIQSMHELKKKIGLLTDSAKIQYLSSLNLPKPTMPDFGSSNDDANTMAQAFYQGDVYFYDFVKDYLVYLSSRTHKRDIDLDFPLQRKSALDYLEWDINFVLNKVEDQVKEEIYKAFFVVSERELLDVRSFKNHIETNTLTNFGRIKDLIKKAKKIIDLYNAWLYGGSPYNKRAKNVTVNTPKGGFISIDIPFECIYINEIDTPIYSTPAGYEDFFDERPVNYSNYQFAIRCLNFIKAVDNGFSAQISIKDIFEEGKKPDRPIHIDRTVYFSYAWNEASDLLVTNLYESLKSDGFKVVRDKNDLGYNERISTFMESIGKGDIVVVVLSDKYLHSDNCMFEFYELYRNSNLDINSLLTKIFPIRAEPLALADPVIIENILSYWAKRAEQFRNLVSNFQYDQQEYSKIESIARAVPKLLPVLKDINTATTEILSANNFAIIKKELESKMDKKVEGRNLGA